MYSNKKIIPGILCLLSMLLLAGCATKISPYYHATNWLIRQNDIPQYYAKFDVICLPPLPFTKENTEFFKLLPSNQDKVLYNDARCLTTTPFTNQCRVFIPKIPLITLKQYLTLLNTPLKKKQKLTDLEPLRKASMRVSWALDYYFRNFHLPGHPFIIMGDGVTAVILYQAMKNCEFLTPDNGFVAAYLPGIPPLSRQKILNDFKDQGLKPADGHNDYGVITTWMSTAGKPQNPIFQQADCYQINPISWKTDETIVPASENYFSYFYDWNTDRLQNRLKRTPNPCSAGIIQAEGRLQINLIPELARHPLLQPIDHIYHNRNLTLFIGKIVKNANMRTEHLISDRKWKFMKK